MVWGWEGAYAMRKHLVTLACAALLVAGLNEPSFAVTLDFEDVAVAPGVQLPVSDFASGGFLFETNIDCRTNLTNGTFVADNGTTYLAWEDGLDNTGCLGNNIITVSRLDGQPFDLVRFDVAEWDQGQGSAQTISVRGVFAAGGEASQEFDLDRIFDGPGPLEDFETIELGGVYASLSFVTFDGFNGLGANQIAIDNLVVPEPTTALLLACGLVGLATYRRRLGQ